MIERRTAKIEVRNLLDHVDGHAENRLCAQIRVQRHRIKRLTGLSAALRFDRCGREEGVVGHDRFEIAEPGRIHFGAWPERGDHGW